MYEITFITKEEKDIKSVKDLIEQLDGKIVAEDNLGRKKFAYPIKKERTGFYWTFYFNIDGKKLIDFEKKLLLNQEIIRFLIIKSEKKVKKVKTKPISIQTDKKKDDKIKIKDTGKIKKDAKQIIGSAEKIEPTKEKESIDIKPEKIKKTKLTKKVKDKSTKTTGQDKVDKTQKKEEKDIEPKIKSIKEDKKIKLSEEKITETERLKKLEEKLDELLKE